MSNNEEKAIVIDFDELDEDPVISGQNYMVISYAFSEKKDRTGNLLPMIKVRGSYSSLPECDKRIKKLDKASGDPKCIPIIKTEVGKWIGLYPYEELYKNENIDVEYKEEFMNEAMRGLRESQERASDKFMDRVKKDVETIKKDATKEGQDRLASEREHVLSVINRFQTYEHQRGVMKAKMEEAQRIMDEAEQKLKEEYTKEEIEEAQSKLKSAQANADAGISEQLIDINEEPSSAAPIAASDALAAIENIPVLPSIAEEGEAVEALENVSLDS